MNWFSRSIFQVIYFSSTRVSSVFSFSFGSYNGGVAFDLYSGDKDKVKVILFNLGFMSENFQMALIVRDKFSSQFVSSCSCSCVKSVFCGDSCRFFLFLLKLYFSK